MIRLLKTSFLAQKFVYLFLHTFPTALICLISGIKYNLMYSDSLISSKSLLLNTKLGRRVRINPGVYLENVSVGDFTYFALNDSLQTRITDTKIGKFCSISHNVQVLSRTHVLQNITTYPLLSMWLKREEYESNQDYLVMPVSIGNDVWIGANAIILGGVKIGDGAIVGAGSIVTKSVEPYSVVVGSPAKIIRFRFSKDEINHLNKLQWWDWEEEKIKKNHKNLLQFDITKLQK